MSPDDAKAREYFEYLITSKQLAPLVAWDEAYPFIKTNDYKVQLAVENKEKELKEEFDILSKEQEISQFLKMSEKFQEMADYLTEAYGFDTGKCSCPECKADEELERKVREQLRKQGYEDVEIDIVHEDDDYSWLDDEDEDI